MKRGEIDAERARATPLDARGMAALIRTIAMARLDADGTFSYVSEQWCALTRNDEAALLGRSWRHLVDPRDRHRVLRAAVAARRDQVIARIEFRCSAAISDVGDERWLGASLVPVDHGDESGGWFVSAAEITDRLLAQELLARSERRLQKIVHHGNDDVTVVRSDGTYSLVSNGRGSSTVGDAVDHGSRRSSLRSNGDERQLETLSQLRELASGEKGPVTVRRVFDGGQVRHVESSGVNLSDDPDIGGVVLYERDVTDRVEALEALQQANTRLALLVDSLPLAVLLVGPDFRVVASNRAFTELCGITEPPESLIGIPEDVISERIQSLLKEPNDYLARVAALRTQRNATASDDLVCLDGRVIERNYIPINVAGRDKGYLWLFLDQTDEKMAASRREHLLAKEQLQNERLRELDAVRREFASMLSHEFRTPLTSIIGFTELFELDVETLDRKTATRMREYIEVIARNGNRLLRLVDDLFLLDRLDTRTLPMVPSEIDLPEIVAMAVSSVRPTAEQRGIAIECRILRGPPMLGDTERLGQMVDNLLGNAMKFTEAGGLIGVTAEPEEDGWLLTVSDTGIGIPEEELPDLFERFYRASNAKQRAVAGSGLGLAISRAIAELHRGTIGVDSAEGVGSTFTVRLRGLPRAAAVG
jgi:PAS domain S-box-containing protein